MGEWSRQIFISNGQLEKKIWPYSLHKIEKGISILPQCYGWWWNNLLQTPDLADYSWFDLCSDDFFSKNSNSSDFFGILSNCGLYLKGGFAKIFSPSVICKFSLGCVVFKKKWDNLRRCYQFCSILKKKLEPIHCSLSHQLELILQVQWSKISALA